MNIGTIEKFFADIGRIANALERGGAVAADTPIGGVTCNPITDISDPRQHNHNHCMTNRTAPEQPSCNHAVGAIDWSNRDAVKAGLDKLGVTYNSRLGTDKLASLLTDAIKEKMNAPAESEPEIEQPVLAGDPSVPEPCTYEEARGLLYKYMNGEPNEGIKKRDRDAAVAIVEKAYLSAGKGALPNGTVNLSMLSPQERINLRKFIAEVWTNDKL